MFGPPRRHRLSARPVRMSGRAGAVPVVVAIVALCLPAAAMGHGSARVFVSARTAAPGASLHIAGSDMEPSQPVQLELLGSARAWSLGQALPNASGVFDTAVQLPSDLMPGRYEIRVALPDGDFVTTPIDIQGGAVMASALAPIASGTLTREPASSGSPLPVVPLLLFAGGLVFVVGAFLFRSRREARRPRP